MKRSLLVFLLSISMYLISSAQTAREYIALHPQKAWLSHTVYPVDMIASRAETPKGYVPFYVSHYGRHGSRYDRKDDSMIHMIQRFDKLDSMGVLTEVGYKVRQEIEKITSLHKGNLGMLTEVGAAQHRDIASRLYTSCREIFTPGCRINSIASSSKRCVASMKAFNEALLEKDPEMVQDMSSAKEILGYARPAGSNNQLNTKELRKKVDKFRHANDTRWYMERKQYQKKNKDYSAAEKMVINSKESLHKINCSVNHFSTNIFRFLMFAQNLGIDETALVKEIFNDDIIYSIYLNQNFSWYNQHACADESPIAEHLYVMRYLIDNMVSRADKAIEGSYPYVGDFRFGHDTHLTPIVASLGFCQYPDTYLSIEEAGEKWRGYTITPMAGNLQMILYRRADKKNDVLVRFLLNENDVTLPIKSSKAPFYRWGDFKKYVVKRFENLKNRISN